jgi:integrase
LTVKKLGNEFLVYQMERVSSGQIGARWFEDCRRIVRHFAKSVGVSRPVTSLAAADFQRYRRLLVTEGLRGSRGLGVHALTRTITVVRGLFKWAVDTGLVERAPRWGRAFIKPSAADVRRSRAAGERENGKRMFTAAKVRSLIESAEPAIKAAILLGINGGFGNTDCAALSRAAVNLKGCVIDFERPKTGVRRIVPLWPETVAGLKVVLATESPLPTPGAETRVVFHSESGLPLVRQIVKRGKNDEIEKVTYIDRLGDWFDDLLVEKKLKRRRVGFYTLRHTFRTWADETNDQHAIHLVMGHAIPGMSGIYIEEIGMKRLRRVVNHVRRKLWPGANGEKVLCDHTGNSLSDEVNPRS